MAENPHGMLQLETKESILFAVHRGVPRSAELATIIEVRTTKSLSHICGCDGYRMSRVETFRAG